MTRFYLTIERNDEVLAEFSAPNMEILEEKYEAWERSNKIDLTNNVDF